MNELKNMADSELKALHKQVSRSLFTGEYGREGSYGRNEKLAMATLLEIRRRESEGAKPVAKLEDAEVDDE